MHAEDAEDAVIAGNRSLDTITGAVIDSAYRVHTALGPGLLESVYETVLARDLERRGLKVGRQVPLSFEFEGLRFSEALRIDLLVNSRVVVEIKSVERLAPVHPKQLLTYLRLLQLPVGLLINFGAAHLKDGLKRIVNRLPPAESPALHINQTVVSAESSANSASSA